MDVKLTTDEPAHRAQSNAVKWLLGVGLLRKGLAIAKSVIANELDLRDWMANSFYEDRRRDPVTKVERDEVWFDYVADTGDDTLVMEALANAFSRSYRANELRLQKEPKDSNAAQKPNEPKDSKAAKKPNEPKAKAAKNGKTPKEPEDPKDATWAYHDHPELQRGEFLFVGGDTAYHVADEGTLRDRFIGPLNAADKSEKRPIFGIPGNHDYYDNLAGFNRLFRSPYPQKTPPVLWLRDYEPKQEASYVKILLPGEWELWGADLGPHGVDYRQLIYFTQPSRTAPGETPEREPGAPKRLILCTGVPPVSFNRVMVKTKAEDKKGRDKEREAYKKLIGTSSRFVKTPHSHPKEGECRLHLAGDKHHYARYSGHKHAHEKTPSPLATVVSGGGGAFLHPTETVCGPLPAALKYPDATQSRVHTVRALLSPFTIIGAGMLGIIGILLSLLFVGTWPGSWEKVQRGVEWGVCVLVAIGVGWLGIRATRALAEERKKQAKDGRVSPSSEVVPKDAPKDDEKESTSFSEVAQRYIKEKSVLIAPVAIIVAIAIPYVLNHFVITFEPLRSQSLWVASVFVFVLAMVLVGALVGAANHVGTLPKVGFGLMGLIHGAIQILLPYEIVQHGWGMIPIAAVACWLLFAPLAFAAYQQPTRIVRRMITVLWLAQLAVIPLLHYMDWLPGDDGWQRLLRAAIVGFIFVPMQFGFYVLTAAAWNGHNNEAGISARVTNYKQWIRFHVTKDELTGYVIAIDDPKAGKPKDTPSARPYLLDKFVIKPVAAPPSEAHAEL